MQDVQEDIDFTHEGFSMKNWIFHLFKLSCCYLRCRHMRGKIAVLHILGFDAKTSFSSTQMIDHKWFWSENFGFVFWVLCLFYGPSFYRCKANGNAQEVGVEVTHWDLDLRPSPRCNMCAWDVFLSTPQRHFCHCHCMLVILPCCNIAPCQSDSLRADWVIRGLGSATK